MNDLLNALPDSKKLRTLADWLDTIDMDKGYSSNEVQQDLRKWADQADAMKEKYSNGNR